MRRELDLEVELALCAAFEAFLHRDYRERVRLRSKGPVSAALRAVHKELGTKAGLEKLLDCWKAGLGVPARAISELKQVMKYRNWLAHGRYGEQKSGLVAPSVDMLRNRIAAVVKSMRQSPP